MGMFPRNKNARSIANGNIPRRKRYSDTPPPAWRPKASPFQKPDLTSVNEERGIDGSVSEPVAATESESPSSSGHHQSALPLEHSALGFPEGTLMTQDSAEATISVSEQLDNWIQTFGLGKIYQATMSIRDAHTENSLSESWRLLYTGRLSDYMSVCALYLSTTSILLVACTIEASFKRLLDRTDWSPNHREMLNATFQHFSWVCNLINMNRCGLENMLCIWRASASSAVTGVLKEVSAMSYSLFYMLTVSRQKLSSMTVPIHGTAIEVAAGDHGLGKFAPKGWLNDEIMNFHVEGLNEGSKLEGSNVAFLDTHFFTEYLAKGAGRKEMPLSMRHGVLKVRDLHLSLFGL